MRGRRRRVRTFFYFFLKQVSEQPLGLCVCGFFFILCNHVWLGEASTDGWMDGWMMGGCYVGKWAGARRYVGRAALLPGPSTKMICRPPLCDGARCDRSGASGSRRQRGASGCYAETPARLVGHWRRAEVLMHAKECVALSVTNRPRCHNSPPSVSFPSPLPPPPPHPAACASWCWRCVALPVRIPS